jgi:hypothetical protein
MASTGNDGVTTCDDPNNVGTGVAIAYTLPPAYPWWSVDLGTSYLISDLVLFGRWTSYQAQAQNLLVSVGNGGPLLDPACASNVNAAVSNGVSVSSCANISGRYVTVWRNDTTSFVSLCEVQVSISDF